MQAPGAEVLADPKQYPRLENYVKGVVGAFANDPRILAWDLWNEPDNGNEDSDAKGDGHNKNEIVSVFCRRSLPGRAPRILHSR